MTTPRPIGTFCWTELATSDADGALAFYTRLFGWETTTRDMGEMGVYHLLGLGGRELGGLYEMQGPHFEGVPPHWAHYVRVESVDATAARATALGGAVVAPAMDIPGVGRVVALRDPTGAHVLAFELGGHQGATIDPAAHGAWGWAELQTRDLAAAKAFYTALFGWQAQESPDYTEWALPGHEQFAGMIAIDPKWGEVPANWMGYVMVEDCDGTFAKAQSLGACPYMPPTVIEGVGKFAVVADPQGAVFSFIALVPQHG